MMNPEENLSPIESLLRRHALQTARGHGALIGLVGLALIAACIAGFVWLESFRYFGPAVKMKGILALGILAFVIVSGLLIYYWLLKKQKLPATREDTLANRIGRKQPLIGDKLLNAIQLFRSKPPEGISSALHYAAIESGLEAAQLIPEKILFPKQSIKKATQLVSLGAFILFVLYLMNVNDLNQAVSRLSHAGKAYDYPLPLKLELYAPQEVYLAGDTLSLEGSVSGRQTPRVNVTVYDRKDTNTYVLNVDDQHFRLPLEHVMSSFTAIAHVENDRLLEPWKTIRSNELNIKVVNRPIIQDLKIRIRPPEYTRLPIERFSRDILDISGFRGSLVKLEGLSSKELTSARIRFESGRAIEADLTGNLIRAQFTLDRSDKMWFELIDDEGVTNLEPFEYPIFVARDAEPLIRVLVPAHDVIIGEKLQIPTRVKLDDDFGFSALELKYQIIHPDYLLPDSTIYVHKIKLMNPRQASQEIDMLWDISEVSIMPEDAIQYWFEVWDNNTVDGPGFASSKTWIARLPSLDEMFSGINEANEEIQREQEEMLEIVKDIRQKVDELAMEVQKDPNLNWSQQQEAEEAMEQVEDLKDVLEEMSKQLDEMINSAEDQNLFSEETLEKYSELQQMMDELITPELMEAMRKLQEAINENRPEEIEIAMEEFQAAMENFERNLERTLEIFKQVELEQKLDEVAKRLTDLAERQEALAEEMDGLDATQAEQLEKQIAEEMDEAESAVGELADLFKENKQLPEELVADLQNQMSAEQIDGKLDQTVSALQQGQMSQAKSSAQDAATSMQKIAESAEQLRGTAQQMMMEDVLSDFRNILHQTLGLSQAQEQLENQTQRISGQSSLIRDYADGQMSLVDGLKQTAKNMQALGEKTFAVSQSMGKSMGAVLAHMSESIRQMEARNPRKSAEAQAQARENLNRMALQIAQSMNTLQQSGESSGLSDYLQQLENMAGQQQGLNQETLMQMGMGANSMMQELARRQLQLRDALSQMEQGMGSDSRMLGDLGKIGEEMEAVAKELQKKRPSQKVHEQQERILNRLLDAQRSATQKDFSKKRKAETAGSNRVWQGVGALPDDLGEARNMLYEELLYSLKQDYDREEKQLIREYLNQLEELLNE
ncbi:MAG: hypothetical protein K9M49_04075 [Candidatus Marinimicrobia bacterium]|nr:hypothetical protein [Candidatus Neomarinimicrobiota bacterium]MCF7851321.1 hypothetical protein [Candidatus Neomarinimicrobiota bacterium]MCF7904312.1 hypothetical protein [Candidatus Neomarinimicrobiota bacterium]